MPQYFAQESARWIRLEGPDAQDFLHRLTTAQVRGLSIGDGAAACFLTSQGRIRSSFKLWRLGPAEYGLEVDSGTGAHDFAAETLAVIDQFTFAEKMTTTLLPDWRSISIHFATGEAMPPQSSPENARCWKDGSVLCCASGRAITLWGTERDVRSALERLWPAALPADLNALERERILALSPLAGREILPESNPLEVGLRAAIADNKGCYPGQEVIEKIIAIGSPPKRLALLEIAVSGDLASASLPIPLKDESGAETGTLTSLALPDRALAILRKASAREGIELRTSTDARLKVIKVAGYE